MRILRTLQKQSVRDGILTLKNSADRGGMRILAMLRTAMQIWAALMIGILATSILATGLTLMGVSRDGSLLIALIAFIGAIILLFALSPRSLLNTERGMTTQAHRKRQTYDSTIPEYPGSEHS